MSRSRYAASALAAVCCFAITGEGAADTSDGDSMPAKPADAFVDAIGVDSHFNYRGTPYVEQWDKISTELIAAGIRHIRDGGKPAPAYLERLQFLGDHGIQHAAGFNVDATPDTIREGLRALSPHIDFVEPENEYDALRLTDPAWVEHLVAEQGTLYSTVHGDKQYAGVTVLGPALASQQMYPLLGRLDAVEDAGNLHNATCDENPGTASALGVKAMTALVRTSTLAKPIWTTETGYGDDQTRSCALPDAVIAKYAPRTIAERFNAGEPRIYFYQLADMPRDHVFGSMGLIRADGSPKPQFTAIASLIAVLADPGPAFAPAPLRLTIRSPGDDVHRTLLVKRGGAYELLLWREVPSWHSGPNHFGGSSVDVAPVDITVAAPDRRARKYYTYDASWNLKAKEVHPDPNGTVRIPVSDSISILEFQ